MSRRKTQEETGMAEAKTNVMRILEQHRIAYTAHEYPHGKEAVDGVTVASSMGQDPAQVFKTLVARGKSGALYVFVVPVAASLNLKKSAKAVGEKALEMVHVKELLGLTGYVRGGCSPVGMKKAYPTVFHLSALEQTTVFVSAGKIGYQIECAPRDLIDLVGAKTEDIID
jgi:Cys-tRNA(Pro)/Cys-tRNA(Cys) deacylase